MYQLFARSLTDTSKLVVLCESDDIQKLLRVEAAMIKALEDEIYPAPETCEIGFRRRVPNGGFQYCECIHVDINGNKSVEFE